MLNLSLLVGFVCLICELDNFFPPVLQLFISFLFPTPLTGYSVSNLSPLNLLSLLTIPLPTLGETGRLELAGMGVKLFPPANKKLKKSFLLERRSLLWIKYFTVSTLLLPLKGQWGNVCSTLILRISKISGSKSHRGLRTPKKIYTVMSYGQMQPPEIYQNYHSNVSTILSLQRLLLHELLLFVLFLLIWGQEFPLKVIDP